MVDLGEKVDNSTLKILNQSACFASLTDFDGFFSNEFSFVWGWCLGRL